MWVLCSRCLRVDVCVGVLMSPSTPPNRQPRLLIETLDACKNGAQGSSLESAERRGPQTGSGQTARWAA